MRGRFVWALLIGLGLAAVLLASHREREIIAGLNSDEFASLVFQGAILLLVGGAVVAMFRERFPQALRAALYWIVIALVLAVGYTYRYALRDVSDHVLAEMIPGRAVSRGKSVEIARGRVGEFQVSTQVNGAKIPMVLDTGASAVVLTQDAARAAGLPLEVLSYSVNVETANGRARAAPVTLDRLAIGTIVERSVPALIAQPGQLKTNLLGMSFLNRLQSWEVRGDRLLMRGYP